MKYIFLIICCSVSVVFSAEQSINTNLDVRGNSIKEVGSFTKPSGAYWVFLESNDVVNIYRGYDNIITNLLSQDIVNRDILVSNGYLISLTNAIMFTNSVVRATEYAEVANNTSNIYDSGDVFTLYTIVYSKARFDIIASSSLNMKKVYEVWFSDTLNPNGESSSFDETPTFTDCRLIKTVTSGKHWVVMSNSSGQIRLSFDTTPELKDIQCYFNIVDNYGCVTNCHLDNDL
jgi:hypothetical protein